MAAHSTVKPSAMEDQNVWMRLIIVRQTTLESYNKILNRLDHVNLHFDEHSRAPHFMILDQVSQVFKKMMFDFDRIQKFGYSPENTDFMDDFERLTDPHNNHCQHIMLIKLFHYYVQNLKVPEIMLFPIKNEEIRETFCIITGCFDRIDADFSKYFHL